MTDKKLLSSDEVSEIISKLGLEFAVVHNPAPLYPEIEVYPLAPKITALQKELSAIIMDLEGTVCSTRDLRLHSLEYVVRSISGRLTKNEWKGLDPLIDNPNLMGIGTSEQIRYLIQRYHNFIKPEAMKEAYLHSVLWTIISGRNEERKDEASFSLDHFGLGEMLKDSKLHELMLNKEFNEFNSNLIRNYFLHNYGARLSIKSFDDTARAATEIFFQHYHQMLELIKYGEGSNLAEEISGQSGMPLLRPLPSIPLLFALVKGWLGEDVSYLFDEMSRELKQKSSQVYRISSQEEAKGNLVRLGKYFEAHPLKLALVTSSGGYEAEIIMSELFNVISHEVRMWKIPQAKKDMLLEKFSDYKNVVDVFITADKVSKIRPKPHRDFFSIALMRLGLRQSMLSQVVGFEDSENGIIALRASGIGLTAAVPVSRNSRHDLSAASFILQGGIAEALLNYNLFVSL